MHPLAVCKSCRHLPPDQAGQHLKSADAQYSSCLWGRNPVELAQVGQHQAEPQTGSGGDFEESGYSNQLESSGQQRLSAGGADR